MLFAQSHAQKGAFDDAIPEIKEAQSAEDSTQNRAILAQIYASSCNRPEAEMILKDLLEKSSQYVSPYFVAMIYASLGSYDQAFDWLQKAVHEKSPWLPYLRLDPRFDNRTA